MAVTTAQHDLLRALDRACRHPHQERSGVSADDIKDQLDRIRHRPVGIGYVRTLLRDLDGQRDHDGKELIVKHPVMRGHRYSPTAAGRAIARSG